MSPNLQIAVITGAARGIGLTIAQRFHAEGYHAIIIDRDEEVMQLCKAQLSGNERYSFFLCDVSDPVQVKNTFDKITAQFSAINALVNNAGIAIFKPAQEVTFEDWSAVMSTNLNGTFLCSQVCFPALKQAKGS